MIIECWRRLRMLLVRMMKYLWIKNELVRRKKLKIGWVKSASTSFPSSLRCTDDWVVYFKLIHRKAEAIIGVVNVMYLRKVMSVHINLVSDDGTRQLKEVWFDTIVVLSAWWVLHVCTMNRTLHSDLTHLIVTIPFFNQWRKLLKRNVKWTKRWPLEIYL